MLPSPSEITPTSPTGGFWRGEAFGIARARVQRSALQGVSVQAAGRRGGAVIFGGGWAGRSSFRRCSRSRWSFSGSVWRARTTVRPSVVGSSTSIIWMAAKFFEHGSGRQSRRQRLQPLFQRHHQAVGEERHEDMGFDAVLELVVDGPNRQIVLQFLERLLDLDQLEIEPPEMTGIVAPDVGAKQIAAFTPPGDAKLLAVQREIERLRGDRLILRRRMDRQQPVGLAGLLFGCAELQQQLVARQVLPLQFAQAFDQLAQPTPPHRLFLLAPR